MAERLAYLVPVYLVTPPCKDLREWVRAGATKADVVRAIGIGESLDYSQKEKAA
ncbi:MAG: hypothetical protein WD042_05325 [Phycisphaeraceae bacterium]